MAIAATVLASSVDTTDATSYTTASISPAANSLLLVFSGSGIGTGTAPVITVSGLGLTWTSQSDYGYDPASPVRRIAAATAQCGATPGSGALTLSMDAGATLSTFGAWVVLQITGHDTTTPVVQTVTGTVGTGTTLSLTLASPVSADSRAFSWWGIRNNTDTTTPAPSWTELFTGGCGSPAMTQEAQWRSDAFDTTASVTWTAANRGAGIALEIAAGSSSTGADVSAVVITATAAAGTPTVSASQNSEVVATLAEGDVVALAPVTAGGCSVAGELATASAVAVAPQVTVVFDTTVDAVVAEATADAIQPLVEAATSVESTALAEATAEVFAPTVGAATGASTDATTATATAASVAPVVTIVATTEVQAVTATATATTATPPEVTGTTSVTTVAYAQATAQAHPPSAQATVVAAIAATSTSEAFAPVVTGESSLSEAALAEATAQAIAPTIDAVIEGAVNVGAVTATATADTGTPQVSIDGAAIVIIEVSAATVTAIAPTVDGGDHLVNAVVATATAAAQGPSTDTITVLTFTPPTYSQPVKIKGSLYVNITESMSVVRLNGVLTTIKSPAVGTLTAAGTEGSDWFIGGHIYEVSQDTAIELQNAGYTVT